MARPRKDGTTLRDDPPTTHGPISMYADLALKRGVNGIQVNFDYVDFPSAEECRKALVRFRSNFGSLKAKDRREANRFSRPPLYEDLGCFLEETPNGWAACIKSNFHFPSSVTEANGEPVKEFSLDYKRFHQLQIKAAVSDSGACDFSQEDIDFFWEFDPKTAEMVYNFKGWKLPDKGN